MGRGPDDLLGVGAARDGRPSATDCRQTAACPVVSSAWGGPKIQQITRREALEHGSELHRGGLFGNGAVGVPEQPQGDWQSGGGGTELGAEGRKPRAWRVEGSLGELCQGLGRDQVRVWWSVSGWVGNGVFPGRQEGSPPCEGLSAPDPASGCA